MEKENKKSYKVQNLGTPSYFIFPTITSLGYKGRPDIYVNNGDIVELTDTEASKLVAIGQLVEIKEEVNKKTKMKSEV